MTQICVRVYFDMPVAVLPLHDSKVTLYARKRLRNHKITERNYILYVFFAWMALRHLSALLGIAYMYNLKFLEVKKYLLTLQGAAQ